MSHVFFPYTNSFVTKILDDGLMLVVQMDECEVENIISIDLGTGDKPKIQKIHKRNQEAFTDLFNAPHQNTKIFSSQMVSNHSFKVGDVVKMGRFSLNVEEDAYEVYEGKTKVCEFSNCNCTPGRAYGVVYVCGDNFLVSNVGDENSILFAKTK